MWLVVVKGKVMRLKDYAVEASLYAVAVVLFIVICVGGLMFSSYMEARAYNNVTGKNVSMWDAMWIDLRVVSEGKEE